MALLNTHETFKKFVAQGITEQHAEVIIDAINNQRNYYFLDWLTRFNR